MRWIHAAGRGLLVLVVVMTGYIASGARADDGPAGGRGPLTLATAGDLTGYLGPLLEAGTAPTPTNGSPSSNCRTPPTRPTPR